MHLNEEKKVILVLKKLSVLSFVRVLFALFRFKNKIKIKMKIEKETDKENKNENR